ncbi:hypothetical protein [Pseudoalteromonas sp. SR45-4]|uniref:hypothetical protein n=1 Tax=Pseudoalteromonas sp. SR45-4 TaxID=2760929 RepID=UPI0015F904E1|nr:hypothetical protein [Pseudoalteromonas sp. SR45-4]MBB1371970.1 hypothetical protein [Pseudoalteromonas sp. SR45-4]
MHILKKTGLTISAVTLTACMSTQPPVLTKQSNDVYQFNEKASFALNVANMTRKTAGLSDVDLPENAQFKSNNLLVGAEYALAFLTDGLVDLAGSMGAQSKADKAFNWKPMLVFLGDLDENNLDASALNVIESGLKATFDNIEGTEYVGITRSNNARDSNNFMYFYKGGALCNAETRKLYIYTSPEPHPSFVDYDPAVFNGSCASAVKIEVNGKVNFNGEVKDVVTMTILNGYEGFDSIAVATAGFSLVPKEYRVWGSGIKYTVPAPYVVHDNTMYLFSTSNTSYKLNNAVR